jgi:hypothetical protein
MTPCATGATFYRAINFNGPATTIDGVAWEAGTGIIPNYVGNGSAMSNPWATLSPSTDAARRDMIRSYRQHWSFNITLSAVPNGTYQVCAYVWQDWDDTTRSPYSISLNGTVVAANFDPGPTEGAWWRLGPWPVTVTNGTIQLRTTGGIANLSGLEIWSTGGGTPLALAVPMANAPIEAPTAATPVPAAATPLPALPTATAVPPVLTGQVVESDSQQVGRSAGWTTLTEPPGASMGSYLVNTSPQEVMAVYFQGTQAGIMYLQGPSFSAFTVEVDGVALQQVDSYAPDYVTNVIFTAAGLTEGEHVLRILPVSGVVAIDAFVVPAAAGATAAPTVAPDETVTPSATPALSPTLTPTMTATQPGIIEPTPTLIPVSPTATLLPLLPPLTVDIDDTVSDWTATSGWTISSQAVYNGGALGWQLAAPLPLPESLRLTRAIDLRGILAPAHASLVFASLVTAEQPAATVQVSIDSANTWQMVGTVPVTNAWTPVEIDLSAYTGQLIQLQFVWQGAPSLDPNAQVTWWIDRVSIQVVQPQPTATPTATLMPSPTATETPLPPTATAVPPTETPLPPTLTPTEEFAAPTPPGAEVTEAVQPP